MPRSKTCVGLMKGEAVWQWTKLSSFGKTDKIRREGGIIMTGLITTVKELGLERVSCNTSRLILKFRAIFFNGIKKYISFR